MGDAYADIPRQGGDFARAISVCINSHRRESKSKGVMCPSIRVTVDLALSTGGHVRLLKAALNGGLGEQYFGEPQLAQAMNLCVACKGCKRECENQAGEQQTPAFLSINPKGSIPVLVRDDGMGIYDFQAIAWRLAREHPKARLLPDTLEGEIQTLEVMNYVIGAIHVQGFARKFTPEQFAPNENDDY